MISSTNFVRGLMKVESSVNVTDKKVSMYFKDELLTERSDPS